MSYVLYSNLSEGEGELLVIFIEYINKVGFLEDFVILLYIIVNKLVFLLEGVWFIFFLIYFF